MKWVSIIAVVCACSESRVAPAALPQPTIDSSDMVSETTSSGPVEVTVSVSPKQAGLGDFLSFRLAVSAPDDYVVTLPTYKETLPFAVLDSEEKPGQSISHLLEANVVGMHRIPSMRVIVTPADGGSSQEIFTKELSFAVTMPPDTPGEFSPASTTLGTSEWRFSRRLAWVAPIIVLVIMAFAILWFARRKKLPSKDQVDPFARALSRLAYLERRGLPDKEAADDWYVELSGIVREFIELRFGLRAPELTTEEFLREAKQSAILDGDDQTSLGVFLALCDRVKFGGHDPQQRESNQALGFARSFIEQARPDDIDADAKEAA